MAFALEDLIVLVEDKRKPLTLRSKDSNSTTETVDSSKLIFRVIGLEDTDNKIVVEVTDLGPGSAQNTLQVGSIAQLRITASFFERVCKQSVVLVMRIRRSVTDDAGA